MLDSEKLSREEIRAEYIDDAKKLLKYLPWLKSHQKNIASSVYNEKGIAEHSMAIPICDSTLLDFVKEVQKTKFLNRNYVYSYSKYHMNNVDDEKTMISKCTIREIKILGDILSKYVFKGKIKSSVWNDGANDGIYLSVLQKIKEILDIYKL